MRWRLVSLTLFCILAISTTVFAWTKPVIPKLAIVTASLSAGTVGDQYAAAIEATGGIAPHKWTVNKLPAGLVFNTDGTLSGAPTKAGSYKLNFKVKDSRNKVSHKLLLLTVANASTEPAATLASSLPSPQNTLQPVTFTAGMVNGTDTYEYQFVLLDPIYPGVRLNVKPYSSVNTWTMNDRPGTYTVIANVRKVGSTADYDYSTSLSYTIIVPPAPTGLTLTSSLASPQESSKHIKFHAETATGSSYALFEFSITYPDGSLHHFYPQGEIPTPTFIGNYEGGSSALWNTFGLPAGDYAVTVYEKSSYSSAAYDLSKSMTYTLTPSSIVLPPTDPAKYGKVLYEKGTEANPAGNYYVFADTSIAKFDAEWNQIWKKTGITGAHPAFDKDGNIVMVSGGFKKIDKDGNLLSSWSTVIPFMVDASVIDQDNNVYYAGRKNAAGTITVHVMKFDAAGTLQWDWSASPEYVVEPTGCHNGAWVYVNGLGVDADGKVHLSGATANSNARFAGIVGPYFLTFDALGNQLSNVSVPSGGGKLFKDGQGNYVTIGTELTAGTNPALSVTKFALNGDIVWQKYLASNSDLIIRDYIQDASGNLYLLSSYMPLPGTPKVVTNEFERIVVTKIDAEGNKVVAFTGGTTPEEWIYGSVVSVDDLGNLFVKTSTTLPDGGSYKALIKFNADGHQEWLK